jgi:hypothetical protein
MRRVEANKSENTEEGEREEVKESLQTVGCAKPSGATVVLKPSLLFCVPHLALTIVLYRQ